MPRNVTVTFEDGTTHVYQGVPDDVAPALVERRASTEFQGKRVKSLDGGAGPAAAAPPGDPGIVNPNAISDLARRGFGRGGRAPTPETLGAMRDNALTRTLEAAADDPGGVATAGAAGFNRGVADLAGIPADTAQNILDLGKVAVGPAYNAITREPGTPHVGKPGPYGSGQSFDTDEAGNLVPTRVGAREDIPDAFIPPDRRTVPLSGDWNARMLDAGSEAVGGAPVTQNPVPENPAARLVYGTARAVPGALTGRQVVASAGGGAASTVVAEAGGDPALQAVAGLAGNRAGEIPRQPAPGARQTAPTRPAVETPPPELTASGAPRTLPKGPEPQVPARRELAATGPQRQTPYTDLEGAATTKKPPRFVEDTPSAADGQVLGLGEQARRKDILRRVGVGELRNSAVQGDRKAAATDFQMSKLDDPQGQHMTRVLNAEREAIGNFAERIADETGGTRGTSQTDNLQRGTNIIAPLDGIKEFFDTRTRALYKVADQRAKGKPFETKKTREAVGDESEFLGTVEGEALLRGVRARMKSLGMTGPDGTPQRTTVAQAERLKQWLGEQWTPRTSRLIKRLKDGVDDDVLSAAGEDVYKRARALRAERARILDDPQGIARVMDSEGPQGINRAVAVERVGDVVTTLPVAQFSHIVKTLNEAPAELRGPAQAALAEIKSHFANKVAEIGSKTGTQWNAKGVSKYLNDNSARLRVLFSPDELRRFADLNDAGHILRFDSSYPGAHVQAQNLKRAAIVEHGTTAVGTAIGSAFGPMGSVAGAGLGSMAGKGLGRRMRERAGLKAAKARTTDLRTEEPINALGYE